MLGDGLGWVIFELGGKMMLGFLSEQYFFVLIL